MNKDLDRDIEHYVSTGGLMEVLEISRSTVYRLMAKGMPNIYGWKRSPLSDKPSFGMVRGESPYYNRIIVFQAVSLFPQYREADF